jgi:HEAT repeat protein
MIQFQSEALQNWLERLSKLFERFDPEGKDGFLENFSEFLPKLDPALLFNLSEQDGVIQSALEGLSPHEIAELSLRILPMEGEVSPRLVKFLTRILSQEDKREEALTLMEDKVSGSWLEDLFSTTKELIFSSNEREFMSEGYEASLDSIDPFLENPYKESFQKEEEYRVLSKFVSTLLFLLKEETGPQEYLELASELREIAKDAILFGHFSLCARILRTFNEHYESNSLMPKETLQVLKDSLEDFTDVNLVQELILSVSQVSEEDFGSLQEIFSAIGTASLKGLLNLLISDRAQKVRKRVKAILSSLRKEALPSIFSLLSHENPVLLRDLIEIMGNIGHEKSLSHLEKFIKDKNPILRLEAVKSLGKIGGRRGAGILIKALKQRDNEVRKLAALYISRMKDKEVVHELISQAIEKNPFGSVIRVEIVKLLGQMKSVEAVPFLEDVLKKRFLLGKSKGYQAAVNALAKIGKGEALRVLQEGAESKRRLIRQECQKALKVVSGRLPQNV